MPTSNIYIISVYFISINEHLAFHSFDFISKGNICYGYYYLKSA